MENSDIKRILEKHDWADMSGIMDVGNELVTHRYVKIDESKEVCFSITVVQKGAAQSIVLDLFDFYDGAAKIICALSYWDLPILERLVSRLEAGAARRWADDQAKREYVISKDRLIPVDKGQGVIMGNGMLCIANIVNKEVARDLSNLQQEVEKDPEAVAIMDNIAKRLPIFVNAVLDELAP